MSDANPMPQTFRHVMQIVVGQRRKLKEGQRDEILTSPPPVYLIGFNDSAGVARTSGAAFLEIALLVAVSIFIGMNDKAAAVSIKQGETAR